MKLLLTALALMALNYCSGQEIEYFTFGEDRSRPLSTPLKDTTVGILVYFDTFLNVKADRAFKIRTAYTESLKHFESGMNLMSKWEPYWLQTSYYLFIKDSYVDPDAEIKFIPNRPRIGITYWQPRKYFPRIEIGTDEDGLFFLSTEISSKRMEEIRMIKKMDSINNPYLQYALLLKNQSK